MRHTDHFADLTPARSKRWGALDRGCRPGLLLSGWITIPRVYGDYKPLQVVYRSRNSLLRFVAVHVMPGTEKTLSVLAFSSNRYRATASDRSGSRPLQCNRELWTVIDQLSHRFFSLPRRDAIRQRLSLIDCESRKPSSSLEKMGPNSESLLGE